ALAEWRLVLGRRERALQIIERRQQVESQGFQRVAAFFFRIPAGALLVVLEVGLGAAQELQELVALLRLGAQLLQVFEHVGRRLLGRFALPWRLVFVVAHAFFSSGGLLSPLNQSLSVSKNPFRCGLTCDLSISASSRKSSSCRLVSFFGVSRTAWT